METTQPVSSQAETMTHSLSHQSGRVRDAVLDAAEAVFTERGLRRGTLAEVARRAGIGRATLYRYFDGKDAVTTDLVLREAGELFSVLDAELADEEDPWVMLERGLITALRYLRQHPLLRRVLDEEPESVLPLLTVRAAPLLEAAVAFASPYIERAVKDERLPSMEPRVAAEWAARILLSLLLTPSVTTDLENPEELKAFVSWMRVGHGDRSSRGGRR